MESATKQTPPRHAGESGLMHREVRVYGQQEGKKLCTINGHTFDISMCVCVCKSVYVYNRVTRMLGGMDSIPTHALL